MVWYIFCILGPKHRQRFLCEVRVDGYSYVAAGNSVTKKEAQKNASRDFLNFLVRSGELSADDVPEDVTSAIKIDTEQLNEAIANQQASTKPVFKVNKIN